MAKVEAFSDVSNFLGVFALSWTTYSTVGYGNTYPDFQTSIECLPLTLLATVEAWIGILHGAFVGAVLFAKVQSIYCCATVIFSESCVIKYGTGVDYGQESEDDDDDDMLFSFASEGIDELGESMKSNKSDVVHPSNGNGVPNELRIRRSVSELTTREMIMQSKTLPSTTKHPFPVLTFRIVNDLCNISGGDIMSLSISAVAIVPTNKVESINNGARVNRRTYPKMILQPSVVSIFERSSYIRHTLDAKSPLLSLYARKRIRQNRGRWPEEFNEHEIIRELLCFSAIHVSLQGISNITKATVYAQKTYNVFECKIGWQFVGVIYHDGYRLSVDMDLINDVVEQEGGGGEPLRANPSLVADISN